MRSVGRELLQELLCWDDAEESEKDNVNPLYSGPSLFTMPQSQSNRV